MTISIGSAGSEPWHRSLTPTHWKVLAASNLGWLLDGYEAYALILTVGAALHQLLPQAAYGQIPLYAGGTIAVTLFGWGLGGVLGGILADYIGRKRTMLLAILAYSLTAGLSAFSWNWESFAALRFLVGIAIGSEWVTGALITAEIWPPGARGRGAGLMQCGVGAGFFAASLTWLFIGPLGPDAWRYMFLIGVLPGFVTLWIRRSVPESELWEGVNRRRKAAVQRKRSGEVLTDADRQLTRLTLVDLFSQPEVRRRAIIALLMSLATTLGWWGVSSWVPPYIASVAVKAGLQGPQWASYAGMSYNLGAIVGYICLGFIADAFGRKFVTAAFFALALLMTPVLFLWTHNLNALLIAAFANGFFTLGQYAWMAVWLPELFPTQVRATAVAFCFNAPRLLAAIGPVIAGSLIVQFGSFGEAAMIVSCIYIVGILAVPLLPETRGKILPETV
jgi:MFS family permease